MKILRWYRALLIFEEDLSLGAKDEKREELLQRLDQIEQAVNNMKVPASFADQFYALRYNISIVRGRVMDSRV
jgi:hypothetical protein